MANFFKDNEDLQYYFDRGIDWGPLVEGVELRNTDTFATTEEAVQFYREVAETLGAFVADEIAPHAAKLDREGIEFVDGEAVFPKTLARIFKKLGALDLYGLTLPRELGGLNAPIVLYQLLLELFGRADVSVGAHYGFHGGMAMAALAYSIYEGTTKIDPETGQVIETRFGDMIAEIAAGKAWGSMDLTEPHAGSDLGALRTRAELGEDGVWRLTGEKIFITSGHGKYHFVIARTEPTPPADAPPGAGLAGLSMFLVKAYDDPKKGKRVRYATLSRVEEKMGHHASPTVGVVFDRTPGELLGKRGEGFKQMLFLMNNARIGVGFESIGLMEAATRLARDYAEQRPSMGKTIDRHELIADALDEMQTDIQGLRALCVDAACNEELGQRYKMARDHLFAPGSAEHAQYDALHRKHAARARAVTPLIKYFGAEKAVEMAQRCVQIHGGVGYTTEYGAEKLLRDAMVLPIYEGTSQIQSLMAMKDALGAIVKNPQAFVARVGRVRWRSLSARDPLERRVARLEGQALSAQQHLMQRTAVDKLRALGGLPITRWPKQFLENWDPKRDFAFAMLHAERLTRILCDAAIARALWAQARRHADRREVLERWLERAEPRTRFLLDELTTTGDRLLAKLAQDEATDATG
ncbi:MAG: acyl-CoA dehydrogenase family protein [Myxococcales bacterium]|nr:acyl-CoA dehydrogenase family protein [Myxococcales bacterium]